MSKFEHYYQQPTSDMFVRVWLGSIQEKAYTQTRKEKSHRWLGKAPPVPVSISGRFFLPRLVWAFPQTWTPHTDRPSQTPLRAEGRGFRHLPALHAHFSFLLSSWEKPRNEFGRNTEGWTGRGWAEPGYWRVLLHVCSTKRTARRKAKTPVRCLSVSGLHRSAGESSQAIGIFNFGKMREGKRARQREREMGGRQTITGKRLLLLEQYKKRKAADRGFSALSWTALGTSSNTSNN